VSRQTLHRPRAERVDVSPEMALRLGKPCGNGPELGLRMQAAHDFWAARQRLAQELERIETVAA
jgi:antitoxin HigA-1